MNEQLLTNHARERIQKRCISPLILDWLIAYGATKVDHRGAEIRYFDHSSRRRLSKAFGHQVVDLLGRLLDTYAVVGNDGVVITAGHRMARINRN